jgi:hypothetical protein
MPSVSEPLHPRSPSGSGSPKISASADRAREQLREEFGQLRAEIGGLSPEQSGAEGSGSGFGRVRGSLAVLALSAAVAAAVANFALHGGRTSKSGNVSGVSGAPPLPEPGPALITADLASPHDSFPVLALIAPGLRTETLGPNGGLQGAGAPSGGPSTVFVVGKPVPVGGQGSPSEDVTGAHPVSRAPTPPPQAPQAPAPAAPESRGDTPPPPGASGGGNLGDGNPGGGGPGNGPGHEKPGDGGGSSTAAAGGPGNGLGKGHIKGQGKGHDGGSPGKGHEKDPGVGEIAPSGGENEGPGGHGGGKNPAAPPAAPPPAPSAEPAPPAPGYGSNGNHGKSGEEHGKGQGKATAPGQAGK